MVLAGGVGIGCALGQITGIHEINDFLCSRHSSLVVSPAAVLAQLGNSVLAQMTNQMIVEVEVCVSTVQRQRLIAVVLNGLADGQELVPSLRGLGDAAGIENILVACFNDQSKEWRTRRPIWGCSTMEFR